MENEIKIGKKIFIRNAGKDEYWLQALIYQNPKNLGLGDLIAIDKEKRQTSGGRLDLLLKDPSDNSMYEVECMLGETDPSHIIRAIEYWDNEKRKYPQRQHFCVLVAESFDRRYFNVIQLMSLNIPMIAIQADLLEVGNEKVLNFTKIIDIYSEPEEDDSETKQVNEATWNNFSPWTNATAKVLFDALNKKYAGVTLRYTQSYISLNINGRNDYWFNKRSKPFSAFNFNVKDEEKLERVKALLDSKGISFAVSDRYKLIMIQVSEDSINQYIDILYTIHEIKYPQGLEEK